MLLPGLRRWDVGVHCSRWRRDQELLQTVETAVQRRYLPGKEKVPPEGSQSKTQSQDEGEEFKALLEEFYSDSPDRLEAALYGLELVVKKPSSDQEQD